MVNGYSIGKLLEAIKTFIFYREKQTNKQKQTINVFFMPLATDVCIFH